MENETKTRQSALQHHHPFSESEIYPEVNEQDSQLISPRPSSSDGSLFLMMQSPPGHESPWILSAHHQTPSPSLLYHCIASLHRRQGNIYAIAASKGLVFTGSTSRRIRVWKQPDCMDKGYLKASYGEVRAIIAYRDILFSTHKDYKIRVWNFTTSSESFKSRKVATLPKRTPFPWFQKTINHNLEHKAFVSCMAYYHSEGLLYTGSHDKTVKIWRISDAKCVDTFYAHEDNINSMLVNQEDGCLFTCSSDGTVKIWRRVYTEDSYSLTMTLKFQPSPVNTMALTSSVNNPILYSGSSDGVINFWEKETLCYRFNHGGFLQGHHLAVLCLTTVGNNLIFSGSEDTTIRVWRREEGSSYHECLAVLDGHRGPVRCLVACLDMEKVMRGFLGLLDRNTTQKKNKD